MPETSQSVVAGQLVVSGTRVYRILGPPEIRPFHCLDADEQPVVLDRYALPVEPIVLDENPPNGGYSIDESCFGSLPRYALVATTIEAGGF